MILLQLTGLSGSGKTTLAQALQARLISLGIAVETIDGDVYRQTLCRDLGFSRVDRLENIRRLGAVGLEKVAQGTVAILAAINPYEAARQALAAQSPCVRTIYVKCALDILQQRDTKGLYRRALLPADHPDHLAHFTGISDPYDVPLQPDLVIETDQEPLEAAVERLVAFVLEAIR